MSATTARRLDAYDEIEIEIAKAPIKGYAIIGGSHSRAGAAWLRKCRELRRPFIGVRLFLSRAVVELDLAPAGHTLTPGERAKVAAALAEHGASTGFSDTKLTTCRLPFAAAEGLAGELVAIVAGGPVPAGGSAA